jgi:glutathione S-transferase
MKMRAVLRYRRLPFVFVPAMPGSEPIASVRPAVIPVVRVPDGTFRVDSTPMIEELEILHPSRSIVPDDPGLSFLSYLLEDFADEWVTKMMFHYRWFRDLDQETFARQGAFDFLGSAGLETLEKMASLSRKRQVGRMALVGCTEENRPLIEATYAELLSILEAMVPRQRFLFGSRPSRADFALYGQLSQLASDPTPRAMLREMAPYTDRWVVQMDDLCGLEGDWVAPEDVLTAGVLALLRVCGEVYLPFLAANAAAFESGAARFSIRLRGLDYAQATFKYQVKCLDEILGRYALLEGKVRERIEPVLSETGVLDALRPCRQPPSGPTDPTS